MCGRGRDVPVLTSLSTCTQIKQKVSVFLLVNNSVGLFTVYKQMTEDKKKKKTKKQPSQALIHLQIYRQSHFKLPQRASTAPVIGLTVELVMTRADNGVL